MKGDFEMKCFNYFRKFPYALWIVSFLVILFVSNASAQTKSDEKPKPRLDIQNLFTASGWMGDGEYGRKYIEFDGACEIEPHSDPFCIMVKYTFGSKKWAGIYWQNKPDNWGDKPGKNYSKKGFTKITFWARGETGKEVVEFKAGDISNPKKKYHDSFGETIGRVVLSNEWKQYTIDLEGADLSSVIGGFCWVASSDYNKQRSITFYIDDIFLEGE